MRPPRHGVRLIEGYAPHHSEQNQGICISQVLKGLRKNRGFPMELAYDIPPGLNPALIPLALCGGLRTYP
jgi:hypothetical protein